MSPDESILVYEGHDFKKTASVPNPKSIDQPRYENGRPTQNGLFADWIDRSTRRGGPDAIFRVYEKIRPGIWTDRGLYLLKDYRLDKSQGRSVFKFNCDQAPFDSAQAHENSSTDTLSSTRQIPSWVKQSVYKRDKGKCVLCGATDQLHFDHDLPYSRGGASVLAENVRILCARHNLAKSDRIE